MAFCTNCGSNVEGAYCPQCGTPQAGAGPAASYSNAPMNMPAAAPPSGGNKGLKIVLFGCLGVIVLGALVAMVTGLFVARKVHDVVGDVANSESGPLMAAAKIAIAANPEVELVSSDEGKGTLTIREKKTGKTITVSFEDIKNGKLVFEGADGEKAVIGGTESGGGGIEVTTKEGTARIGAGDAKLPAWLPAYPGSKAQGLFSATNNDGLAGSVGYETSDGADKVEAFYKDALDRAGVKVTRTAMQQGETSLVMLTGSSDDKQRTANVTITVSDGTTKMNVTYQSKE